MHQPPTVYVRSRLPVLLPEVERFSRQAAGTYHVHIAVETFMKTVALYLHSDRSHDPALFELLTLGRLNKASYVVQVHLDRIMLHTNYANQVLA